MGKKKKPKLPKLRIPVPAPTKKHSDEKRASDRKVCRKKVEE